MSNGKKQLSPIKQEHNGPTPNYNEKFANLGKFMPPKEEKEEYHSSGLPETLVRGSGERVKTEELDEGQFSQIKRGPIPTVPHVIAQDDSDKYRKGENFYIK